MANILDSNGLTLDTRNQIFANMREEWQSIYGGDVNFDSNTPDGQVLQIFAQMCADYSEVIREVYNSFFPNKIGATVQDERYAINGIFRKEGSYTIQTIKITVDKTVTLEGLDQTIEPYTVQSDNGEQWYLLDTVTITTADPVQSLSFRAKEKGNVQPAIGTITSQVTVVQGVISVNNEVAPTSYGTEEGTDEAFAIRREQSVSNPSKNNITAIKGNILALPDVNQCEVYQYEETFDGDNNLITDSNGIPVGGSWVIVDGGDGYNIANTIYDNNSNNILKGSITENILTVSGQTVAIKFDRPLAVPLFIKFDIQETVSGTTFDINEIKSEIVENCTFKLGQYADSSYITDVVRQALLDTSLNGVATGVYISSDIGTASATKTSSTITSVNVDVTKFYNMITTTGSYVFTYNGSVWELNSEAINIDNYGITFEGEASTSDTITVTYTEGTWTEYIPSPTVQSEFVVDATRIYITEINI